MYAAGLTMKLANLGKFIERFEEVVSKTIDPKLLVPEIAIDAELDFVDISERFYDIIRQFGPFGPGNMKPVFVSKAVRDKGYSRVVGEDHLKLHLTQDGGRDCKGIAFGMGPLANKIMHEADSDMKHFDICYSLGENDWRGVRNIELNVKDIKVK